MRSSPTRRECGRLVRKVGIGAALALALLLVCIIGPGQALAAPPYQVQQLTANDRLDADTAVYGGRVAWVRNDPSGGVLCLYDGLTGMTSEISHMASVYNPTPVFYGDLLIWSNAEAGGTVIRGYDIRTGEQRLVATLKDGGAGISTDGRYVAWSDYNAPGEPRDVVLYDWSTAAIEKLSNDALDEYDVSVRDGYVIWERQSAVDPDNSVDVLLHNTYVGATTVLTGQAQRFGSAYIDSGRVVWLEGPWNSAAIMLYQIGQNAAQAVPTVPSDKFLQDFRGDKVVWTDGLADAGEICVLDVSNGLTARLTQNAVPEGIARTDGRLVTWIQADATESAWIHDCVSGTTYQLSASGQEAGPPSLDRGRAAWFGWVGSSTEIYTVRWPLFNDVPSAHQYFAAVQALAERRLIDGYSAANGGMDFRPDDPVLRAQYAKMIDGALDLVPSETMTPPADFSDLGQDNPKSLYPHEYVWTAYKNQIVFGYSDGTFHPYAEIQGGHVLTMTVRALQSLHPLVLAVVPASFRQTWGLDLLAEHKANARIAEYNNLLTNLPPDNEATSAEGPMPRQEVAQVMYNMMRLLPTAQPYPPD